MKTISDAKSEYIDRIILSGETKKTGIIAQNMNAFDAGIEFAQRWIPVAENLPPVDESDDFCKEHKYSTRVLVVEKDNIDRFGYYIYNSDRWVVEGRTGRIKVTHWRALTIK